jgi:hypothetical protein
MNAYLDTLNEELEAIAEDATQKLNEQSEYQVYFVDDELWLAYGQGSGSVSQIRNIKKAISNKRGDATYDSNVDKIVKYSENTKPMKTNKSKDMKMFEIPVYTQRVLEFGAKYDVWGGDVKPVKKRYMVVSTRGIAVVNFFDKKNEAIGWVKSST